MHIRDLGRVAYAPTFSAMKAQVQAQPFDEALWLCEHDPVFTLGIAARAEHVLAPGDIPVVQTDRGGQVTYHGPGQVVAYPLIDLRARRYFVKEYVFRLEEALIRTLAELGVTGHRVAGAPGIYVRLDDPFSHAPLPQRPQRQPAHPAPAQSGEGPLGGQRPASAVERGGPGLASAGPLPSGEGPLGGQRPASAVERGGPGLASAGPLPSGEGPLGGQRPASAVERGGPDFTGLGKIAALGIKVSQHHTYHGVSLNVAMDLNPFLRINPCGYAGLPTVDLSTIGVSATVAEVGQRLGTHLQALLGEPVVA
ncbi:lipoyl(octanoyl) transferase LipB [Comamonas serinivorans]|uniref:lipoyl(octanoyl) transferase LipB n=1 Tax=Comamonas serinivorans TaxID=1082851 RepID=UPI001F02C272|nr:lipoyl(octanoyl) transferase LipB [Comamonas serinivorans]